MAIQRKLWALTLLPRDWPRLSCGSLDFARRVRRTLLRTAALTAAVMVATEAADAAFVISLAPTVNVTCASGVCAASAPNAVLNAATLQQMLGAASTKVSTGAEAADIIVEAPLSWPGPQSLTLDASRSVIVHRPIAVAGLGGLTIVTSDGGSSGAFSFGPAGNVTFAQSASALSIDGARYELVETMAAMAALIGANLAGNYALARPLNAASVATWTPIGTDGAGNIVNGGAGFSGNFDGLGNAISNLVVDRPTVNYVGPFGYCSGEIRNVGVVGGVVNGNDFVGGLVGFNRGRVSGAGVTGDAYRLAGILGFNNVGGIVGQNDGAITASFAATTVADIAGGGDVGGLVGYNSGQIANAYATGTVADYPSSSAPGENIGGLVGNNAGQIADAYATAAVVAPHGVHVGGFAGYNGGGISRAIATGNVGASFGVSHGGLIGDNQGAAVNGYWDLDTTGQTAGVGAGAKAKASRGLSVGSGFGPFNQSSYVGLDFSSAGTWGVVEGLSFPYQLSQCPAGAPQVISGTGARAPNLSPGSNPYPYLFGFAVGALVDGVPMGVTTTGHDGVYQLLVPHGTIGPRASQVLTYILGSLSGPGDSIYNPTGNGFYNDATGSIAGLDIFGHYVTLNSGALRLTTVARGLAQAQGSQRDGDFIFSVGGGPHYTLKIIDPPGLPTGSSLAIYSSAENFNLDQAPSFGSPQDFLLLAMAAPGATLTQSAPVAVGRLSLLGSAANFALTNAANQISVIAADAANLDLSSGVSLSVGKVNLIRGVKTAPGGHVSLTSGGTITETSPNGIATDLLNVSANTGIILDGRNNIANVGVNHTNSGLDIIRQH